MFDRDATPAAQPSSGKERALNSALPNPRGAALRSEEPAMAAGPHVRILGRKFREPSLFWIFQCGGWAVFGAVMFAWALEYWNLVDALVNKGLMISIGFVLTLGFRSLYRRLSAASIPHIVAALLVGIVSFAGAAIWIEAHLVLFQMYYSASRMEKIEVQAIGIPLGTLISQGLAMLAWSLLYFGIKAWGELEMERYRAARAEATAHAARLRALQSQLEPHFLFNTLNAISTLVVEGHNSAAARMITRLSNFLRLTLDTAETPEITVAEELEFVRRYLEIEQVRFGDRLRVTIDASPEVMQGLVPALVLQPLVENAVKHGILPREAGGSLAVSIARHDGALRITVADDGPGLSNDAALRSGVGLANTAERLEELYGEKARLSLDFSPGRGEATIELPFRTASPRLADSGQEGEDE
jgi:two-component system LytT family sensor kinase